eukprot:CAMPEP_0170485592 /NCGR_PEP_ID=MMETSP0208-20121228/4833_1 /TAXON_ID=197538 /ORGANISM="Strombidium inclinatum, Strain S3" /LENGTH=76 /DNA_ID=CAMNT_0010759291 /DNA_START=1189 /DNA_END=1419 /DNA_ORIENTATION=-
MALEPTPTLTAVFTKDCGKMESSMVKESLSHLKVKVAEVNGKKAREYVGWTKTAVSANSRTRCPSPWLQAREGSVI